MNEIESKVAVVTGGASGIGFGMVRSFLDAGMKVVAADVRQDHLDRAASDLGARDDVRFMRLDVTDRDAYAAFAADVIGTFGKVHLVCNNAGVGVMGEARNLSYADWDWSLRVNLDGVFNGVHTFLPYLLAQGEGGHIVNTASVAAVLPASIVYGAPKAAVMAMSEGLRSELAGDGIGVTCLMPGPVASNIHQVAQLRPAEYEESKLHAFEQTLAERPVSPYWMDPRDVGEMVLDAVRRNLAFVFTHNEHREGVARRFEAILAAFPRGRVDPERAANLGFRIANPMYDEILAADEDPARPRRS
ncbi:hypothetical protein BH09PSE4_BH09PSE4_08640 [soil metagenome]